MWCYRTRRPAKEAGPGGRSEREQRKEGATPNVRRPGPTGLAIREPRGSVSSTHERRPSCSRRPAPVVVESAVGESDVEALELVALEIARQRLLVPAIDHVRRQETLMGRAKKRPRGTVWVSPRHWLFLRYTRSPFSKGRPGPTQRGAPALGAIPGRAAGGPLQPTPKKAHRVPDVIENRASSSNVGRPWRDRCRLRARWALVARGATGVRHGRKPCVQSGKALRQPK